MNRVAWVVCLSGCVAGGDTATRSLAGSDKPELVAPTLAAAGATRTSITVRVCGAGEHGAPEGFSVQWAPAEDAGDGWPEDACGASFSGNAKGHRYALDAGECVE